MKYKLEIFLTYCLAILLFLLGVCGIIAIALLYILIYALVFAIPVAAVMYVIKYFFP